MTRSTAAQVARMNGASICGLCTQPFVEAINSVLLCQHHLNLVHAIAADAGVPREAEVSKPVAKLHSSQQMVECPTCHKITKGAGPAAVHRKLCGVRSEHRAPSTEHRAPSTEHRAKKIARSALRNRQSLHGNPVLLHASSRSRTSEQWRSSSGSPRRRSLA